MKLDDGIYHSIGKQIRKRREELGWSLVEFETRIRHYKTKSTLDRYEKGSHRMDMETLSVLCDALSLDVNEVLRKAREENNIDPIDSNLNAVIANRLQIVGSTAGGSPILNENFTSTYFNADYGLEFADNSMAPTINNEDIVLVQKSKGVENGELALISYDNRLSIKRFYYYSDSNIIVLRSDNMDAYHDVIINGAELKNVKIMGKAVGVIRKIK